MKEYRLMQLQEAKQKLDEIARNYCMMVSLRDAAEDETFEEKEVRVKAVAERVNKALNNLK